MSPFTTPSIFVSHSVCATVAWVTTRWVTKSVDEVGSTVFYWDIFWVFATSRAITKADLSANFTIFYCRMSTIQPAWPVCTTLVCWHTCCWHFCSCSSHKTIPFLREFVVTERLSIRRYCVFSVSVGITQVWVMMARIGYKENDNFTSIIVTRINGEIDFFLYSHNSSSLPTSSRRCISREW